MGGSKVTEPDKKLELEFPPPLLGGESAWILNS